MTSKQIESHRIHTLSHDDTPAEATWEIALQLAIQAEHQAETVKLLTRSIELQEVVHLARPAELETLRNRVDELLNANNAEVERRREAEFQRDDSREGFKVALRMKLQAQKERDIALLEVDHWRNILKNLKLADPQQGKRDAVPERCQCGCAYPDHFKNPERSMDREAEQWRSEEIHHIDWLRSVNAPQPYIDAVMDGYREWKNWQRKSKSCEQWTAEQWKEWRAAAGVKDHTTAAPAETSTSTETSSQHQTKDDLLADPQQSKRDAVSERSGHRFSESGPSAECLNRCGTSLQQWLIISAFRPEERCPLGDPQQGKMTPNQRAIADEVIADMLADPQQSKRDTLSQPQWTADGPFQKQGENER